METIILGDGPMGTAVADALAAEGHPAHVLGRPPGGHHPAPSLRGAGLIFDFSRGPAVAANVAAGLAAGCRAFVIGTTAWDSDRDAVAAMLESAPAAAVTGANLSLGVALFGRLVAMAASLFDGLPAYDPFIVEWHRRAKADRPSGTAKELARRLDAARRPKRPPVDVVSIRAGSSPGMHLVGFDAPGETVELRLTARDRSAYADGALAAARWLVASRRQPGLHPFERVVDDLLVRSTLPSPTPNPPLVAAAG
ncbi:MAG TPA: dihydrodipicolinate reductase C-terminal domain-containing protein [Candidatus Limnocylindrales bacterium]|jgi:4-hydroxy-tetrahydrodipicolinate reductase